MTQTDPAAPDAATDDGKLDAAAYQSARLFAINLAKAATIVNVETLDALVRTADTAQTLGPIMDPTLAREAGAELEREVRLFRALRTFRAELEALR